MYLKILNKIRGTNFQSMEHLKAVKKNAKIQKPLLSEKQVCL